MNREVALDPDVELADDICSLSLARRMAALLDRSPETFQKGDPLPRGWHVLMFNPPTVQSLLREDGAAHLGFKMPDLGLPRLMLGGRSIEFYGDIPIGERVERSSMLGEVVMKEGRAGPFALVDVEHRLSVRGAGTPAVVETCSYILRGEGNGSQEPEAEPAIPLDLPEGAATQIMVPDETMLFRYSAITDNPHRIHYDFPYATGVEGYPALVVNGSLPQMLLLEMFREKAGREPARYESRNKAPIYCGSRVTLSVVEDGESFALRAFGDNGKPAIEAEAW